MFFWGGGKNKYKSRNDRIFLQWNDAKHLYAECFINGRPILVFRRDSLCRFSYSSDMISITFWVQKVYSASPAWVPSWLAKWMMSPLLCFQLSRPLQTDAPMAAIYSIPMDGERCFHVVSSAAGTFSRGFRKLLTWSSREESFLPLQLSLPLDLYYQCSGEASSPVILVSPFSILLTGTQRHYTPLPWHEASWKSGNIWCPAYRNACICVAD